MERNFTDGDISALVEALRKETHQCRFEQVSPEAMQEAVKFYQNWNRVMCETSSTARKALVVMVITGAAGLTVVGFFDKIKQFISKG